MTKSLALATIIAGPMSGIFPFAPFAFADPAATTSKPAADTKPATDTKTEVKPATDAKVGEKKFTKAQIEAFLSKCSDEADAKGLDIKKGKGAARKVFRRECMHKFGVDPK